MTRAVAAQRGRAPADHRRRILLVVAAIAAMPGRRRCAQEVELSGGVLELDAITVTRGPAANRNNPPMARCPVERVDRGQLQPLDPSGVAQVLDLVPSVNTQTTPRRSGCGGERPGPSGFRPRKRHRRRRATELPEVGHGANGTFYFDTEMLRSVEVTRGPSVGHGLRFRRHRRSGELHHDRPRRRAGARRTVAFRLKATVETNAPSFMGHGEAAARLGDSVAVVAAATWRDAGDYRPGGGETINSAQDLVSGLAKARIRPTDSHDIAVSALHYDPRFDSALSTPHRAMPSPTPIPSTTTGRPVPTGPIYREDLLHDDAPRPQQQGRSGRALPDRYRRARPRQYVALRNRLGGACGHLRRRRLPRSRRHSRSFRHQR